MAHEEAAAYGRQLASADVETGVPRFDGLVPGVCSGAVPGSAELHGAVVTFLTQRLAA